MHMYKNYKIKNSLLLIILEKYFEANLKIHKLGQN